MANIIETQKTLFDLLINQYKVDNDAIELKNRCLTLDDEQKDFVKKAKIWHEILCFPHKKVMLIEYNNRYFIIIPEDNCEGVVSEIPSHLVTINYEEITEKPSFFAENAGFRTLIWSNSEYWIKPNITKSSLKEVLEGGEIRNISGKEVYFFQDTEIAIFFKEFDIWEITGLSPTESNKYFEKDSKNKVIISEQTGRHYLDLLCYKIYGMFLCQNKSLLSLNFEDNTISEVINLFEKYGEHFSDSLFRGITSSQWNYCFLELYRCIERLYAIPYTKELIQKNNIQGVNADSLAFSLEQDMNFRVNEQEAITKLLINIQTEVVMQDCLSWFTPNEQERPDIQNISTKIGKEIYKCRNSIVHWRKIFSSKTYQTDEKLIYHLLRIINKLYELYSTEIS